MVRLRPNAQFFVFTDDPDWINEYLLSSLPTGSMTVVSLATEEEFILVPHCCGNSICSSRFSLTAAWLNNSPDRAVDSSSMT
jgi:hypothetical protein